MGGVSSLRLGTRQAGELQAASEFMDTVQRDLLGKGIDAYTADYLTDAATRTGLPAPGQEPHAGSSHCPSWARQGEPPGALRWAISKVCQRRPSVTRSAFAPACRPV